MDVVAKDLKGADFDKRLVSESLDGIKLRPFYRAEDMPSTCDSVVRGYSRQAARPAFREEIRELDIASAHEHILRSLERGAFELAILTFPFGAPIRIASDLEVLLEGVWIDAVPIHWMSGPLTRPMLALLAQEADRRGISSDNLQGSVEFDPIMDRCAAWTTGDFDEWQDEFIITSDALKRFPQFCSVTIRGSLIEKAGASLAQELAFSIALFTEYLSVVTERHDAAGIADFVRRSEFRLGVGTNYFLEIAKVRALKLLVHNVLAGFGIHGVRPRFHAITTSTNKTLYDPYNNLLRATVEAMSATIGGVDSLSVAAYDQGYGAPDEFSEHLTRNTEALLLEEAHIGRVADPLGGSYTVERLTHEYAVKAWDVFQKIESLGGFVSAWQNGAIAEWIHLVQAKRVKQVGSRRRTIVGTTVYPNPKEQRLSDVRPRPKTHQVSVPSVDLDRLVVESLHEFVTETQVPSTALDPFRPSWPFERLRLRLEKHVSKGGKRPVVLLAEFGPKKMRRARSMFVQGFLGAGGYDMVEVVVNDGGALIAEIERHQPDAVVLCSADEAYLEFVRGVSTTAPLFVAGNPTEVIDDLRASGVDDFLHVRLDQLETIQRYHERFGIPTEEPIDAEGK